MKDSDFGNTTKETIISTANGYLKEMQYHSQHLRTEVDDFLNSFQKLTELIEDSYLIENGLSEQDTKTLLDINRQATNLITKNEEIGNSINANCKSKLIV